MYRLHICRVGQNHIYTVYIWCFWQGNHQIYGHIRCIYTVLANPTYLRKGNLSFTGTASSLQEGNLSFKTSLRKGNFEFYKNSQ